MKALTFARYAKPARFEFTDVPRPALKPDDLLVKVHAVGLNPIDTMIPKGEFKPLMKFDLPAVVASDVAGEVVEVGSAVSRFKVGDAIFASLFDLNRGTLAEFAAVPESAAAMKPETLDFAQAASIPMVGLTTWQALKERAGVKPGKKVFIPAGSGGIGTFAIQLAKHLGAKVGTTTSTGNVGLVRDLGADEVVDYKTQAFEDVLKGYDVVLGTVRGDNLKKAIGILNPGGTAVSLIGPPDPSFARGRGLGGVFVFLFTLISGSIRRLAKKRGVEYSFLFVQPNGQQLAEIAGLIDTGAIRPVIDTIFPFDQAKEALAYLEQGRAKGKVVVTLT